MWERNILFACSGSEAHTSKRRRKKEGAGGTQGRRRRGRARRRLQQRGKLGTAWGLAGLFQPPGDPKRPQALAWCQQARERGWELFNKSLSATLCPGQVRMPDVLQPGASSPGPLAHLLVQHLELPSLGGSYSLEALTDVKKKRCRSQWPRFLGL